MNKIKHNLFPALFATFVLSAAPAMATPLNLTLADSPDIVSLFVNVVYDDVTDTLTASGLAANLYNPPLFPIAGGVFNLSATIDDAGNLFAGSVSILGTIAGLGFNSGTLLTGTLTAVGGNPVGQVLEFLFTVTGGDAAGLYGSSAGIIMGQTGFSDWTTTFESLQANADVAPLPAIEPPMLLLQAMGILLIGLTLRSRRSAS